MKFLILGSGKTGSIVAQTAVARGHSIETLRRAGNPDAGALTPEKLRPFDAVIDFTTPQAVLANIRACVTAKKNMVVGTTGWTDNLAAVRDIVQQQGVGFVHGANFSIGVNLFYESARTAAAALKHAYSGQIFERHHASKKDAPSGTAAELQKIVKQASAAELEITSFREGEVVGMHELVLSSPNDTIYLCHDAKSRQGFAEGAVKAAEWLHGKKGFFDFREIWPDV